MAESFNFELVSPERLLLSESASEVIIPGTDGEMTVMANHAPVMTTIKPGNRRGEVCLRRTATAMWYSAASPISFPRAVTLLAESAVHVDDIDREELAQRIQNTREDLADAKTDADKSRIAEKLDNLLTLQDAV